jgi:predicted kinase
MTGELIILCGISGSGKSSFAKFLFDSYPQKYTIVNRDKIRELIFGYTEDSIVHYWTKTDVHKYEKEVTEYEDVLIYEGLNKGKTVIVDATHLKRSYLERFKYWNVKTYMNILFTSLEECIDRDLQRSRRVGVDIITKQHKSFESLVDNLYKNPINFDKIELVQDKTKPNCTILDIDGTISEPCDRNIYDNVKCIDDHLQEHIFNAITNVENLIVCTGRSIESSKSTLEWLSKHNINFTKIYFRNKNDYRPDWVAKEEMWRDISKSYNIELIYEDRNQVVRRARALDLKVAQVKYGNY